MKTNTNDLTTRLATLNKRSTKELRAAYEKQHGRSPSGFSRLTLIKVLATTPTGTLATPAAKPSAPKPAPAATTIDAPRKTGPWDPRLPAPGTVLERTFKGRVHKVTVRADGFEYAGKTYRSLTAAAKAATGYPSISGTLFFGVAKPATKAPTAKPATPKPAARKAAKD